MSDMDLGKTAVELTDHGHSCHTGRVDPIREVWSNGYVSAEKLAINWMNRGRALESELAAVRARVIAALEGEI